MFAGGGGGMAHADIGGQWEGESIFIVFLWTSFVDDPKVKFYYEKEPPKTSRVANITSSNERNRQQ